MRIALVSFHFSEYSARLCIALSKYHQVQLHLSESNARSELTDSVFAEIGSKLDLYLYTDVTRRNSLFIALKAARRIRKFNPHIVHGQEAGDWALALTKIFIGSRPFVYTVHDPIPHTGRDQHIARRNQWPRRFLRRSADVILVHGSSSIRAMEESLPGFKGKMAIVMHGILGTATPPPATVGDSFMFFGRIEAYKGLDVLLDAVTILNHRKSAVRLIIVGRGSDLERHRSRIAELKNVELEEAFVSAAALPGLLREARALVLPYHDASQSGVVTNAFAAGVPVIASKVGSLVDVLDDDKNALLVPPGDPVRLADAMARLVSDDELVKRLANGAAVTATSTLAWAAIATTTGLVYADLCPEWGGQHEAATKAQGDPTELHNVY